MASPRAAHGRLRGVLLTPGEENYRFGIASASRPAAQIRLEMPCQRESEKFALGGEFFLPPSWEAAKKLPKVNKKFCVA